MLVLYAALVTVSGVLGLLFAVVVEAPTSPRLFFLVSLPPTAVGFAVYGGVTVATVLGVPLLLVRYASRYDDASIE